MDEGEERYERFQLLDLKNMKIMIYCWIMTKLWRPIIEVALEYSGSSETTDKCLNNEPTNRIKESWDKSGPIDRSRAWIDSRIILLSIVMFSIWTKKKHGGEFCNKTGVIERQT